MSRVITQRESREDSAAVLREVESGQTLVITRHGTPVTELRPFGSRRFVQRERIIDAARSAPRIDARRFRADVDALTLVELTAGPHATSARMRLPVV